MPRPMWLEEFVPMIGQSLLADCSPKAVELKLIEASPLQDRGATERPPFILIFRSTPEILLVSGGYALRCGEFGPVLVYLEPMVKPPRSEPGQYYQAIFN